MDGCKAGWVVVSLDGDGHFAGARVGASLQGLFRECPEIEVTGVDMPLHLLDAPTRPADELAREVLGGHRGRSVFPALPRFVIEEQWIDCDFETVNEECRRRYGRAFSRQSMALRDKIAEVNAAFAAGHPVIEVHPELSFAALNDNRPLEYSKKCWGGFQERFALLEQAGIILGDLARDVGSLPADDILDAAAAAWSAHRYSKGLALAVPPNQATPTDPQICF